MARKKKAVAAPVEPPKLLKLDLGCGKSKRDGFEGVDILKFDGVDHVVDLTQAPWPWADNSVEEFHTSHFVEHLTAQQRVIFANEVFRTLVKGGKAAIIVPHFASCRAYGDPTHQWPPVSEFWFYYLNREWRKINAPHTDSEFNPTGFNCDFDSSWGYSLRQDLISKHTDVQQFAVQNYKEAAQDLVATITKR